MELQLQHLSVDDPAGRVALHDVSLALPVGVCGLLGAGGAGKSTLLRVLAGAQGAGRGSVARLDDTDLLAGGDSARRLVGYLPQDFASSCTAGADEVLNHYAVRKGIPGYQARRDVVEALLTQVGLWDAHRQPPGVFTDGMRRRFGLAVALLGRPPLLLLDAPTAGLDVEERARMLSLVSALGQHHIVLLATRDIADVADACARVALLDRGELRLAAMLQERSPPAGSVQPAAAA